MVRKGPAGLGWAAWAVDRGVPPAVLSGRHARCLAAGNLCPATDSSPRCRGYATGYPPGLSGDAGGRHGSCLCAGGAFQAPLLAFQTASAGGLWMEGARALWEHFQTAVQSVGQLRHMAVETETLSGDQ